MIILDPCYDEYYQSFRQFFDLNDNQCTYVTDKDHRDSVDFLVCNHFYHPGLDSSEIIQKYRYKRSLFLDIKHAVENKIQDWHTKLDGSLHDITVVDAYDPNLDDSRIVFSDFLFNRTKAYYQGYTWNNDVHLWYHRSAQDYSIPRIIAGKDKTHVFVSPSRVMDGASSQRYRAQFAQWLVANHQHRGWIGAIGTNNDLYLHSQTEAAAAQTLEDLANLLPRRRLGGYSPPHTAYYEDTFISIYCETIEYGNTYVTTEKTFDPLIKGHFILPFSNAGFVNRLRVMYDFAFPDFIDYSYDSIQNDDERFQAYLREAHRLINLSDWPDLWDANQHIIEKNKRVFVDRPYHRIDLQQYL